MAYRIDFPNSGLGRYFEVNPDDPRQAAICDRCGARYNINRLTFQAEYRGSAILQNTRALVCNRCLDIPTEQLRAYTMEADPLPSFNVRPETYAVDETSWLSTMEGSILDADDGPLITSLPNPDSDLSIAEEAAVNIAAEDDAEIVTEAGEGNPLDLEPNPSNNPSAPGEN